MAFCIGLYAYAIIVNTQADQLLPQLLMEQFDTLPIQCRHIEHMHEGVWFRKNNFWQNDSCENLRQFFPNKAFVYALMVPSWADQLLPQLLMEQFDTPSYNVDTLNICMKEFGSEKIVFDKNATCENLRQFFPNKAFVYA